MRLDTFDIDFGIRERVQRRRGWLPAGPLPGSSVRGGFVVGDCRRGSGLDNKGHQDEHSERQNSLQQPRQVTLKP